ncbi:MAG: TlpA family protein disulfide reductase [Bacteroidia bacterium]|nr:TlpA family protein disulfide reductase [Bacteroidia bacterium]
MRAVGMGILLPFLLHPLQRGKTCAEELERNGWSLPRCVAEREMSSLPHRSWREIESYLLQHPDTLYVLTFWATWCRPCVAELPHLQAAYTALRDSFPLQIWLISLDFPPEGAQQAGELLRQRKVFLPAFWLSEKDPNQWIPRLNPQWDGALPYTQAGLRGPSHAAFTSSEDVKDFVRKAYVTHRLSHR